MVCGVIEEAYEVEKARDLQIGDGKQRVELRRGPPTPQWVLELATRPGIKAEPPQSKRYIAISGTLPDGKTTFDWLLRYKAVDDGAIDADFERLVAENSLEIAQLGWDELVKWHGTGHFKNGMVAMY